MTGPVAALGNPPSLGQALARAFERFGPSVCAIEADRDRENLRLTFDEARDRSRRFAGWLSGTGLRAGDRVAILLTNQARWHLAACGAFHRGAVLVPLDFKLTAQEHLALLAHARPAVLVVEDWAWRAMAAQPEFAALATGHVVVVGAAPAAEVPSAPRGAVTRWETAEAGPPDDAPPVSRLRDDLACVVYSSGTAGRAKGCLLTHGNYLAQLESLTALHPFGPGVRYLSILPTNHAIDFMVGFLGPYLCGATVVHLRTLRPEWVRDAFTRYRITHAALVPLVLRNLQAGLAARLDAQPAWRRAAFRGLMALNGALSGGRPRPGVARHVLRPVHAAFGGALEALFVGGARTDPDTLRFFHALGIPVANGYGLTEAGTAVTLDRLDPPRPDTVGKPLPGVEVRIDAPDADGVGEVLVRGGNVMRGYLDDEELTARTLAGGWLHTGDLGRFDNGALVLLGRRKNMIVTEGGKNVYPEDVEASFEGTVAKEICLFAAHWLWPDRRGDERLVLVARMEDRAALPELIGQVAARNRRLADWRRVAAVLPWDADFPRTASLKVKREVLAGSIRDRVPDPGAALQALP